MYLLHSFAILWPSSRLKCEINILRLMQKKKWSPFGIQHFLVHLLEEKCGNFCQIYLSFFLKVHLAISYHWFRWWVGTEQLTSYFRNQWWFGLLGHICPCKGKLCGVLCAFKIWSMLHIDGLVREKRNTHTLVMDLLFLALTHQFFTVILHCIYKGMLDQVMVESIPTSDYIHSVLPSVT